MLAIEKSKSHKGNCTPNVLPCRINHNGAVDASRRYWNPTKTPGKTPGPDAGFYLNCVQMAKLLRISEAGNFMGSK